MGDLSFHPAVIRESLLEPHGRLFRKSPYLAIPQSGIVRELAHRPISPERVSKMVKWAEFSGDKSLLGTAWCRRCAGRFVGKVGTRTSWCIGIILLYTSWSMQSFRSLLQKQSSRHQLSRLRCTNSNARDIIPSICLPRFEFEAILNSPSRLQQQPAPLNLTDRYRQRAVSLAIPSNFRETSESNSLSR